MSNSLAKLTSLSSPPHSEELFSARLIARSPPVRNTKTFFSAKAFSAAAVDILRPGSFQVATDQMRLSSVVPICSVFEDGSACTVLDTINASFQY